MFVTIPLIGSGDDLIKPGELEIAARNEMGFNLLLSCTYKANENGHTPCSVQ